MRPRARGPIRSSPGSEIVTTLERTRDEYRDSDRGELFEALKMQARLNLGLPLLFDDTGDNLSDEVGKKLEDSLVGRRS